MISTNKRRIPGLAIAVSLALASVTRAAIGQQVRDSTPLRADYRDLNELLAQIPNVAAPVLDESRALWIGALPLACLDRLQSRPGVRGGAGRGNANLDSASARGRGGADSTGRAGGGGGGGGARGGTNSGAGYFWVATYTLMHDHDRLRAFWGCSDWHSAVASTWVTVRLLKRFPKLALEELAREKLNAHLGKSDRFVRAAVRIRLAARAL
jgi:hypothetical protein